MGNEKQQHLDCTVLYCTFALKGDGIHFIKENVTEQAITMEIIKNRKQTELKEYSYTNNKKTLFQEDDMNASLTYGRSTDISITIEYETEPYETIVVFAGVREDMKEITKNSHCKINK